MDVNASRTISGVGVAAAGTARDLELLGTKTLKYTALAGGAGIATTALGAAAVGAAGFLGVGLGGALIALGTKLAFTDEQMKKLTKSLKSQFQTTVQATAGPVRDAVKKTFGGLIDEIKRLRPAFADFFKQVAGLIGEFGKAGVGVFRQLVVGAGQFLKLVRPILDVFAQELGPLVGSLGQTLQNIIGPLAAHVGSWRQFLVLIEQLLPALGMVVGSLVQLGVRVLPQVAPLLLHIVDAVQGLLVQFGHLGEQILPTFNQTLGQVVDALSGGLAQVLPVVGRAINTMLPAIGRLAEAVFPALAAILQALEPVLANVVATLANSLAKVLPGLVPGFVDLIRVVGGLFDAVKPLLPSLTYLALWMTKVTSNLLGAILPVVSGILGALMPALKVLLPILIQVVNAVGNALAEAFKQAAPSLVQLAKALGTILIALAPLIPAVVKAALSFAPLIPAIAKITAGLAEGLVPIVLALTPLLVFLGPTLVKILLGVKLWTIAQAALNIVLSANPIGIVIIALAALTAGIIWAWKHSETFRKVVEAVWHGIRVATASAVTFILRILQGWLNTWLTIAGGIVHAAAIAFGWVPGLGGKLKAADRAFKDFRDSVNNKINGIIKTVDVTIRGHDKVKPVIDQIQSEMKAHGYSVTARLVRGGAYASGGRILGYGGGDIVPIMAEPGEAIVPKDKAKRPEFMAWAKAMGIPGYAAGGIIRWPGNAYLEASRDALMSRLVGGIGGAGAGVQRWAGVFLQALAMAGQPAYWLGLGLRRMQQESGGNPYAINLWDINAQRGDPSRGLMQVIGATFAAYANGLIGRGIYDPLANIFAAIRYTMARYGTLAAWGRPGGYAAGLDYVPFDNFPALLHRGERVLPASRANGDVHIHFNGPVYGDRQALIAEIRAGVRAAQRRDGIPPSRQIS